MERTDFEPWNGREVARLLALVENQRRYYQDMVASLPVGLVVLSANRTVVSANRAFRQAFGLRIEDLRGKTIEQILPSDRLIEKIREDDGPGNSAAGVAAATSWETAASRYSSSSQLGRRDGDGNAADGRRRERVRRAWRWLPIRRGRDATRAVAFRQRSGDAVARGRRVAPVHGRSAAGRNRCWDIRRRTGSSRRRSSRSGFTRRIARRCSRSTGPPCSTPAR